MAALIDTRTVGKLETFDGTAASWSDWSFKAASWFALLNPPGVQVGDVLEAARIHNETVENASLCPP